MIVPTPAKPASISAGNTERYRYERRKYFDAEGNRRRNDTARGSIKRAADWLRAKNVGALVVASDDAVLGIISERDIVRAFSQYGESVASMPVKDIMTHGVITVAPGDDLNRVMRLMTRHRVRHLPVLRNGKLAGIISIGDVVKRRLDDLELETNVLRDVYIASH